jgi:hypothetical protein
VDAFRAITLKILDHWFSGGVSKDHLFGGGVSILGTLLLGIGWVGRDRLERWNAKMESYLEWEKALRDRLFRASGNVAKALIKNPSLLYFEWVSNEKLSDILALTFCYICLGWIILNLVNTVLMLVLWLFGNSFPDVAETVLVIGETVLTLIIVAVAKLGFAICVIVPLCCACAVLLISRLLFALCWLSLVPYRFTRWVEKAGALERTFILLGTAITVCGIALCTWTPY